jgi:AAHS family 4-hydroxybenzoate transporter-like MFS transporter
MESRTVNVSNLIENQKVGGPLLLCGLTLTVMAWCFLTVMGDGYDYTAMAYAAPAVIKTMHVARGAMGNVFGAGLFGIMLGGFLFGFIGDRLGRKTAVVSGTFFFGVLTLATMFAQSLDQLFVMRFIAGFGIGGAVPNAIALTLEYAPHRLRATLVTIMMTGYTFGASAGGFVAAGLVPHYGWQAVFFLGGIVPILVSIGSYFVLPESIRFLAVRQEHRATLAALAKRLDPQLVTGPDTEFVISEPPAAKHFSPAQLFSGSRAIATPLLWLIYITNSLALFFLSSWLPILIESAGASATRAALTTSGFQLGGLIGGLLIMRLTDRYGAIAIAILPLIGIPVVAALGTPGLTVVTLAVAVFLAGICVSGGQSGIHSVAGMFYPVAYRSNGVGWALSVAKIGSIAGPVIGGWFISAHMPLTKLFMSAASPLIIVVIGCLLLGRVYLSKFTVREAAAVAAAAALFFTLALPARAQTLPVVHVTLVPIDAGAEVFYAKDMGFFAKAGIDVDIQTAANGGAAAAAVAGNAVDIGYSDMVSIASGFAHGVPFVVVAPAALHEATEPTNYLMVAANSPIRTAKDLSGKIVAGSGLGTISGYAPRAWIEANGGDVAAVKFVELPFPQMQPALDAGRVDAVAIAEPFLSIARKTDRIIASPYDAVAKEFLISAFFTTSTWAKEHPDLLNRFVTAMHEAAVWGNANHAKSAEILLKYAKIDPELAANMVRIHYGERLSPALMQPVINVAAKYSKFTPFPADAIIYKPGK